MSVRRFATRWIHWAHVSVKSVDSTALTRLMAVEASMSMTTDGSDSGWERGSGSLPTGGGLNLVCADISAGRKSEVSMWDMVEGEAEARGDSGERGEVDNVGKLCYILALCAKK